MTGKVWAVPTLFLGYVKITFRRRHDLNFFMVFPAVCPSFLLWHFIIDIGWICPFSHCGFAATSLRLSVLINNFLSMITDAAANTTSATNWE